MFSIRWRVLNQLRMNSVVMVGIVVVLCVYGLVTNTSLFEPNFYALWMTANIDGLISGIGALILKNVR